jgi:cytochrome b pre-mRNA-processing protein 3
MAVFGMIRRNRHERAGFTLYGSAVQAARASGFYAVLGVPDTLDGRFDLVGLHAFLLIRRLGKEPQPGPELGQAVFDAMFSDMDMNLRELGVGDMSVGKRVKAMWEAFNGRSLAYEAALSAGDADALATALALIVWRGAAPDGMAARLAAIVVAQDAHLAQQTLEALASGRVNFLTPDFGAAGLAMRNPAAV